MPSEESTNIVTAYYNEIDPFAAQWLRNLIAAGHIAPGIVDTRSIEDVKQAQGRTAGSSCDPAADDMSGKEPTPSLATPYWPMSGAAPGVRIQVDAQSQSRETPRRIRSTVAHLGLVGKSACFENLEEVSPSFWRGISPPSSAFAHGSCERMPHCLTACKRQNKATCCFGRGQSETKRRKPGSYVLLRLAGLGSFSATSFCIASSSIFYGNVRQAFRRRIRCNEVAGFSYSSTY